MKKMKTAEVNVLRVLCGKTLKNIISHEKIYERFPAMRERVYCGRDRWRE